MPNRPASSVAARVIVLVAAVPALASCSGAKPAPAASPTPRASSSAMAPAQYQQVVSGINEKLAADTQQLSSARTPTAVSLAASLTETDVSGDVRQLQGISAPPPLKAAQVALISALRGFYTAVGSTDSAAGAEQVCAGSSAMAMISRSSGAAQLQAAETRLATADPSAGIQAGSFLPAATADTDRQLANGAVVKRAKRSGLGLLTIDNGGSTDAVLSLVRGSSGTAAMAIYVRAKSSYKAKGIADGSYIPYMTSGTDWDAKDHLFTRDCDFEKFNANLDYVTKNKGNEIEYTTERITLTSVAGGNVTLSKVPPSQFPAP